MVAIAKEEKQTETGVICPMCFRVIKKFALSSKRDRYRIIRTYYGWCDECNTGCEVIQFYCPNTKTGWLIHRYRLFKILEGNEKPQPVTTWLTMNKLPEPAPVVTGPGGDYDTPFTPDSCGCLLSGDKPASVKLTLGGASSCDGPALTNEKTIELVETTLKALQATVRAFESLLKFAKMK